MTNDRRGHNAAKRPGEVGFQPVARPEPTTALDADALVSELQAEYDHVEQRLRRAQVAALAEQVHRHYPEVAALEFQHREYPDTIIPPLAATFDVDGELLPEMVADDLNANFRSGFGIDFGDHVEGQVIDLNEARQPGYIDGVDPNAPAARAARLGWPSLGDLLDDATSRGLLTTEEVETLNDDDLDILGHRYVGSTIDSIITGYGRPDAPTTLDRDELDRFRERCVEATGSDALHGLWKTLEGSSVPSGVLDRMTRDQIVMFHRAHVRGPASKMASEIKSLLHD